ncbi:hypothetical protein ACOZ4N_01710 [Halorientalis pallida]|uniref:hypothetical protein n=1 Tax=Halorientalis pallida TaxID=2479928 RepID=UPI003C705924
MGVRDDERAQSIQIGAVLLFGALILAFASYQAFIVPEQNRNVEFSHNQQVQQQLQELRNGIVSITGDGDGRSVTIPLGTTYPDRAVAVNPGPVTGTLRTVGTTDDGVNASIANATTGGETGDFWNGTTRNLTTGALAYEPNYNVLDSAGTTWYENSVLYSRYREGVQPATGQRLISGSRLTLVALNGSLSVTRSGAATVDVGALSASTRRVAVTNTTGERVVVTVPTRLNQSTWETLLEPERVAQGGHVAAVDVVSGPGEFRELRLGLEQDVTYQLQLARAGVGTRTQRPEASYLTTVSGDGESVAEAGSQRVVVEVRDRFNNPVSGVRVDANTSRDDSVVRPRNDTTDEEGRAVFTYRAPDDVNGGPKADALNASLALDPAATTGFDATTPENVSVALTVRNTDGSGTSSGGGGAYTVSWRTPGGQQGVTCSGGSCDVNASKSGTVLLTMETNPTADDAAVEYTLSDGTVGVLNTTSGQTNASGADTVGFDALTTGDVSAFTTSGGSGDELPLTVTEVPDCNPVLSESFESGTLPSGWTYTQVTSPGDGGVNDDTSNSGQYSAFVSQEAGYVRSATADTTDCSSVTVEAWVRKGGSFSEPPESGEDLYLQYQAADDSWNTIAFYEPEDYADGESFTVSESITDPQAAHADFRLRWYLIDGSGSGYDFWHFDDVSVDGS